MICFIATNYNNAFYSKQYYSSLKVSIKSNFKLIIVDNNSNEADYNDLCTLSDKTEVVLLRSEKNVGYFAGLNIGIRYAREHYSEIRYYVVGNNDLELPLDFEQKISLCKDIFDKYPVISPRIVTLDGEEQNPHVIQGINPIREFIYDLYYANYYLACAILKLAAISARITSRKDVSKYQESQEIAQGYGACYILTPKFFDFFDELWAPTFLMYEEYFLSKQLEEKNYKVYYESRINLIHHYHASTGKLPAKFKWSLAKKAHREYRKYVKGWL